MNHLFSSWEPWHGAIPADQRRARGRSRRRRAAYAIYNLQERGEIFIEPATDVCEG